MCVNHKALLQFNDNFNHFVSRAGTDSAMLNNFKLSLYSADTRFLKMYEKAKEDHTFRTDIPFEEFMRETGSRHDGSVHILCKWVYLGCR